MLKEIFASYPWWTAPAVSFSIAILLAYLVAEAVARGARFLLVRVVSRGDEPAPDFKSPIVKRPIRLIRRGIFALTMLVLVAPALELAGYDARVGIEAEQLARWATTSGLRVVLILMVAWLLTKLVRTIVDRVEREVTEGALAGAAERAKRIRTLGNLVVNTVGVVVFGAATLMVLKELNVDIMPLLTGAGILGLAIGFGAQTLVKDVISGFFLILENQVRVGDVASINGTGGMVESITLRTISLRDFSGTVHVFPNGSINTLANLTKDFSFAVLDIGVAYKEDTDQVNEVLRQVGEELARDERFGPNILAPLELIGVESFGNSEVVIRIRIKTLPLKQWETARELRRRIKKAFDAVGIEIPFPQRTLHLGADFAKRWPLPAARSHEEDGLTERG